MRCKITVFLIAVVFITGSSAWAQHFRFLETGVNASIMVQDAVINNHSLQAGDEIGVFTPGGLCAGACVVTERLFPVGIVAFGDDDITEAIDGFQENETFHFRLWDASEEAEREAVAGQYLRGDGRYAANGVNIISVLSAGPRNTPPRWEDINEDNYLEIIAGCPVEFELRAEDSEGDELTYNWERNGLPEAARLTDRGDGTALFNWRSERRDTGEYHPVFIVSDGEFSEELEVTIVVTPPPPEVFAVPLRVRWSMVSTVIPPAQPNMMDVFQPLTAQNKVEMVKDHRGRFYAPFWGYNGIGDWDWRYGYQVKMVHPDTLWFRGEVVDDYSPIPLIEGWSIAAYLPETPQAAPQALANLGNLLLMAKDADGNFYNPQFGYSNMGLLRRNQGYQVKVSEAAILRWAAPE